MMKKKFLISVFIVLLTMQSGLFAQSRKYFSQFSHLQGYYNPSLIGYEGSMLRGFVRNQWAGWEGAPKTFFISAELDFSQFGSQATTSELGKNATGINVLYDQYGAFIETEVITSYAARIQLNDNINLRLGAGFNFNNVRLDGNSLTAEQANDPILSQYLNGFADMQVLDFNLGMAITHAKYYLSYAVSNVNQGAFSRGDIFMERKPRVGVAMAGFRSPVGNSLNLATNALYRHQNDLPDNIELNFKVLIKEKLWLGGGHRINYSNSYQFGLLFDSFRVGYIYEMPMLKSYLLPNVTHEFMLTYALSRRNANNLIW
ncbi:PorP/SprF family type IX secretion system membrane protein [Belliella sp. DSM 111904]|uniref:PorP/SprF family type IX secretion system membrane protein n=1 Tax=Belliella filtrata TaxID=2923435 RepID=A0ABS9UZT5_9BACT|nr:PorP/SprF family type IX secretion system membrane protein [Belliella filtrata]MCH7409470.1 PorP/SprF family type IX secretion system membrane protein [Belliella filtrata]